jgi:hypothetical protein
MKGDLNAGCSKSKLFKVKIRERERERERGERWMKVETLNLIPNNLCKISYFVAD